MLGDLISGPRSPKMKHECSSGICRCVLASLTVGFPDVAKLDFELISPIRAVTALDDAEADEPWEYITRASLNDGSVWKGKSYGQAVASTMQPLQCLHRLGPNIIMAKLVSQVSTAEFVVELFGNAHTLFNPSASHFGKYTELQVVVWQDFVSSSWPARRQWRSHPKRHP